MRTTKLTLTLDEAIADVRAVIDEYGADYRYESDSGECMYFELEDPAGKAPSCIVGHVFARHGLKRDDLAVEPRYETHETNRKIDLNEGISVTSLVSNHLLAVDDDTHQFLSNLQANQDSGISWGESFEIALNEVKHNDS